MTINVQENRKSLGTIYESLQLPGYGYFELACCLPMYIWYVCPVLIIDDIQELLNWVLPHIV